MQKPRVNLAQNCGLAAIRIMSAVLAACTSRLTSGSCREAAQIFKWVEVFSLEQDENMGIPEFDKVKVEQGYNLTCKTFTILHCHGLVPPSQNIISRQHPS